MLFPKDLKIEKRICEIFSFEYRGPGDVQSHPIHHSIKRVDLGGTMSKGIRNRYIAENCLKIS